ncbi:hypothetical protein M409DRAFT_57075 [Zasmidium cellare ATCC 36951]|uniref:Uncharacterized protein n=1 Tax=Zasmidium cellare ATCC 36951 TaxID=1080233 RepID=A0A6A6CDG8_ZASCE|nr:uncharacterized protein M409DRAFT_57075 [Zasmidium cellare ATCC 36951]KAF2163972.1 hypothetical protein M409DRAFT_57075 [Zasmidium cellare ATCC 36951]
MDFAAPLAVLPIGPFVVKFGLVLRALILHDEPQPPPEPEPEPEPEEDDAEDNTVNAIPITTTRLYASLDNSLTALQVGTTLACMHAKIASALPDELFNLALNGRVGLQEDLDIEGLEGIVSQPERFVGLQDIFGHVVVRLEALAGNGGLSRELESIPGVLRVDESFEVVVEACLESAR